jgi:hypothetical protein
MRDVAVERARAAAEVLSAHGQAMDEAVNAVTARVGSVTDAGRGACSAGEDNVPLVSYYGLGLVQNTGMHRADVGRSSCVTCSQARALSEPV